jgi:hypothetical protein
MLPVGGGDSVTLLLSAGDETGCRPGECEGKGLLVPCATKNRVGNGDKLGE